MSIFGEVITYRNGLGHRCCRRGSRRSRIDTSCSSQGSGRLPRRPIDLEPSPQTLRIRRLALDSPHRRTQRPERDDSRSKLALARLRERLGREDDRVEVGIVRGQGCTEKRREGFHGTEGGVDGFLPFDPEGLVEWSEFDDAGRSAIHRRCSFFSCSPPFRFLLLLSSLFPRIRLVRLHLAQPSPFLFEPLELLPFPLRLGRLPGLLFLELAFSRFEVFGEGFPLIVQGGEAGFAGVAGGEEGVERSALGRIGQDVRCYRELVEEGGSLRVIGVLLQIGQSVQCGSPRPSVCLRRSCTHSIGMDFERLLSVRLSDLCAGRGRFDSEQGIVVDVFCGHPRTRWLAVGRFAAAC